MMMFQFYQIVSSHDFDLFFTLARTSSLPICFLISPSRLLRLYRRKLIADPNRILSLRFCVISLETEGTISSNKCTRMLLRLMQFYGCHSAHRPEAIERSYGRTKCFDSRLLPDFFTFT
jgi:hypothetical protein